MIVLIIDDHFFIHETLTAVTKAAISNAVVYVEAGLPEGIERMHQLEHVELVLLDLGLPGYTGIEALKHFLKLFPDTRVAIISGDEDSAKVQSALVLGAAGYIPKSTRPQVMVAAIRLIAEGGKYVPSQLVDVLQTRVPTLSRLTERQLAVLKLLVQGLGNREIAKRLEISESTAKQHAHAAYRALGVSTRVQATVAAARLGIDAE